MRNFLEWLDDKHLTIIVIFIFGIVALLTHQKEALELIEKLAYGLLGMAVGKRMTKRSSK